MSDPAKDKEDLVEVYRGHEILGPRNEGYLVQIQSVPFDGYDFVESIEVARTEIDQRIQRAIEEKEYAASYVAPELPTGYQPSGKGFFPDRMAKPEDYKDSLNALGFARFLGDHPERVGLALGDPVGYFTQAEYAEDQFLLMGWEPFRWRGRSTPGYGFWVRVDRSQEPPKNVGQVVSIAADWNQPKYQRIDELCEKLKEDRGGIPTVLVSLTTKQIKEF